MSKSAIPSEPRPEELTCKIDSREQNRIDPSPLRTIIGTLTTGDYSIVGLEHVIAIERKSLPDLLGCCGRDRERFDREVMRLLAYPVRALVVESNWQEIEAGDWRSDLKPSHVIGSLLGWVAMGLPLLMVDNHEQAGRYISRLLFTAAKRRWREARALVAACSSSAETVGTTEQEAAS